MSIYKQSKRLIRSGEKIQAGKLLIEHLKSSPEDEKAWLLLVECVDLRRRKITSLRRARALNPKNRKTKKTLELVEKGKNPQVYRKTRAIKILGVLIFGLVLPLASVAGARALLKQSIPDYLPPTLASPLIEQPLSIEYNFSSAIDESEVFKGETGGQIVKGEETLEEFVPVIPDIPTTYCVPKDTKQQQGVVVAVIDAQRIQVDLGDEIVTVRYLGIETPAFDEFAGPNALEANRSLEGHEILLVSDGLKKNSDGELLSYVFTGDYFINYQLTEWGLATALTETQNLACAGFLMAAENVAKENEIGIWEYVDVRLDPADWKNWPVVPLFSKNAIEIYQAGLEAGHEGQHFSIMGDCQAPEWRMFGPLEYQSFIMPEDLKYLQPTLNNYSGQWVRNGVTVKSGNTVASLFSVAWSDPNRCGSAETPIDCELRVNNPAVSLIMLGTNWPKGQNEAFNARLRDTIRYLIDRDVLPIIVTKGDATGPDYPLNLIMAQVAYDFDIPLWNFWSAIQDLDYHGMDPTDARNMHISTIAFPVKRWTGLQTLHALNVAVFGE